MVNGEVVSDGCGGMNVDARLRVGQLGYHPRQQGHTELVKLVGEAVVGECLDDGVAGNDLAVVVDSRVSVVGCFDVGCQRVANLRQLVEGVGGKVSCPFLQLCALLTAAGFVGIAEAQTGQNLVGKTMVQPFEIHADVIADGTEMYRGTTVIAREKNGAQQFDNFLECRS